MNVAGELHLTLVHPDGPANLEEWFSPLAAADHADWPADPGWLLHERAALLEQPGVRAHVLGVAKLRGAAAGCFQVRMELVENLDAADVEVWVDPTLRRRGIGRALLAAAEAVARDHGRTVLWGTTEAPLASPEAARRARFARTAGYDAALEETRSELHLPVEPFRLDALADDARTRASGYRTVAWEGPCPHKWIAGRLQVARSMSTDVPSGDLEVEPEVWDAERLAQLEQVVEAMDRATIAAAAIAPDNSLVGFTELGVPRAAPRVAYQFDTIVMPAHRGRRLGKLLKVANLRALGARFPSVERVITTNATSNAPMLRVNSDLGFRRTGTGTVWQKRLS